MRTRLLVAVLGAVTLWAQSVPPLYRIDTVAATLPSEEGVPVAQAYLGRPACALSDGAGSVLIVEEKEQNPPRRPRRKNLPFRGHWRFRLLRKRRPSNASATPRLFIHDPGPRG